MGYGDYTPSGGSHPKKPLTKAELRKIQEAYKKADKIRDEILQAEKGDQKHAESILDELI